MKEMLKRTASMLITLSLCLPNIVFAAKSADTVYLYEDFNNYSTNETVTKLTVENTVPYVKNTTKNEKALEVAAGISMGKLKAKWSGVTDSTVIAFDVTHKTSKSNLDFSIVNAGGTTASLLSMKSNGEITTYDGKRMDGFGIGSTRRIAVVIDNVDEVFNIYIDGRCKIAEWRLPTSVKAEGMDITISGGDTLDGTVLIDNVRAYAGKDVHKKFNKTAYNDAEIEIIEAAERVGANIITQNDFEMSETIIGDDANINEITFNVKGNAIEVKADGDNHYLRTEQTTTSDFHLDTQFTVDLNYLTMEMDVYFEKFGSTFYPFNVRDNVSSVSNVDQRVGTVDARGAFQLVNGQTVANFRPGIWYNIAATFNLPKRTINVYIDHKLVAEDVPFNMANFYKPRMVRTWVYGTAMFAGRIDNYNIYEAREPKALSEIEDTLISVMSDGTREQAVLEGRTAMCISNGLVYKDGVKEYTEVPDAKDDDYYVSAETAKKILGGEFTGTVALKAAAKEKGLAVYEDAEKYLLIFSEKEFAADDALMDEVSTYMKMVLPSAEQIKADFEARNQAHPRILATADEWARIRQNIKDYPEFADWHGKIIAQADTKFNLPVEWYYLGEVQAGNILHTARRFKEKMLYWGYAWQTTGDRKYVDAAVKEMKAVSEFPDWSLVHSIDTGELLFGSAVGYDWMYDALTEEERKIIEEGTLRLGIEPLRSAYYGRLRTEQTFGSLSGAAFVANTTNFNVVTNGGLTAAALAYADIYPEECFDALSKAIQSLGYMLPGFEPSGGWEEGANYWDYTTAYLSNMVSSLYTACGTDYGILQHPGVSLTPYYAVYLDSFQGLNNFSDTSKGYSWNSPQFSCFGKYMNEPALTYQRYVAITQRGMTPNIFDMIWLDMSCTDSKIELPLDNLTPGIEMVSMREDWERSDSMNFGTHGGDNTAYHGHYDGGTWVFDLLGERWAMDLGMDEASYHSNPMTVLYRTRAEGHNMLVFNPSADPGFKKQSITSVKRFETAPKGGLIVYDNSGGYAQWTSYMTRGFYVGDERRSLTVRDEFKATTRNSTVYWNMQTPAQIEVQGDKAILTINGKKLQVEFASNTDFEVLAMKAEPLPGSVVDYDVMAKDPTINKLAVKMTVSGEAYIEAKLSAVGEPASKSGMMNIPISEWTLPEGELIKRGDSTLSSLTVNGTPWGEFKPNTTTYNVGVLEGNPIPTIGATSENGEFEIKQAESFNDVATITAYDKQKYYSTTYVVKFVELKKPQDVLGMTRHVVHNLQVSSTPEEANVGPNMLDGDLTTRWAGQGIGETALFDLGSVQPIDAFALAFEWGDERNYKFDIEVSEDGFTYERVFTGQSSGTSEELELIRLDKRVNARYVRYVGNGNTVNTWNGVREFAILAEKGAN